MNKVIIQFQGLPPFKANPGPGPTRGAARQRQQSFGESAKQALNTWRGKHQAGGVAVFPWDPMSASVVLQIQYTRAKGENDAANIIGGIADALQEILYADDKQLVKITYAEKLVNESSEDYLVVEVSSLGGPVGEATLTPDEARDTGPVAAGPVAAGPVAAGPVAAGPVAAGPVAAGPVAAGPVAAGPGWDTRVDDLWSARAAASGDMIAGSPAATDAARVIGVPSLKTSEYKTLQGLLAASEILRARWIRQGNTIIRR